MAFTKFTTDVNNHQSLPDKPRSPSYTAASLKILFDKAANDLKTYINSTLTTEIESTTAGDSGADNIGADKVYPTDVSTATVMGKLKHLYALIQAVVLGDIPDRTLTNEKIGLAELTNAEIAADTITNGNLATDIKVGSLAALSTTDKDSVTDAINETNSKLENTRKLKNWIINGGFDVWQRETSQTTIGYGSDDRWVNNNTVSTKTHLQQAFTIGQTDVPNNPKYYSRTVVTSGGTAASSVRKGQPIEDVSKLSGKTFTLSFWAKADANKNISIEFTQYFGSGGSASVNELGVQKIALTNTWGRYTVTVTLPSVSGKTINAGNYTALYFWFDAGSDFNARTNSLGNQSGAFDIANVSLVEGSIAQEWQNEPFAEVLRQCERYCKSIIIKDNLKYYTANTLHFFVYYDDMRIVPTLFNNNAVESVDFTLFNVNGGSVVSGFTISLSDYLVLTKTSHGVTNAALRIDTNKLLLDAEL